MVERGACRAVKMDRWAADRHVDSVHVRIVGHRCPDVWSGTRVCLAGRRQKRDIRIAWIESPAQLPGYDIEPAHDTTRHIHLNVVGDTPADDDRCAGKRW